MKIKSYQKVTEGEVEHGFRFVCKMSRLEDILQRAPSSIMPDNKSHCSCWIGDRLLKNPLRFLPLFGNAVYLYAESPDHWKIVAKRPSTYKVDLELACLCLEFWDQDRKRDKYGCLCPSSELKSSDKSDETIAVYDRKRLKALLSNATSLLNSIKAMHRNLGLGLEAAALPIEDGYRRMRTEDLIALLQQHPGKQVLI